MNHRQNKVYLYNEDTKDVKEVHVFSYASIQGFDYVSFDELRDINLVLPYINYQIVVKKDELPKLEKDTYYFYELIGCKVIDQNLNEIGEIIKIEEYSANKTLRIKLQNNQDLLLPFMKNFIKKVDIENKVVNVFLIEGMI